MEMGASVVLYLFIILFVSFCGMNKMSTFYYYITHS